MKEERNKLFQRENLHLIKNQYRIIVNIFNHFSHLFPFNYYIFSFAQIYKYSTRGEHSIFQNLIYNFNLSRTLRFSRGKKYPNKIFLQQNKDRIDASTKGTI